MSNIQKLIDQTFSYGAEAANKGDLGMAKCYSEDREAFIDVKYLLEAGYTAAAAKELDEMDTCPREQMVMAMAADGIDIEKYGYKM